MRNIGSGIISLVVGTILLVGIPLAALENESYSGSQDYALPQRVLALLIGSFLFTTGVMTLLAGPDKKS
jgi:hypothetical protein